MTIRKDIEPGSVFKGESGPTREVVAYDRRNDIVTYRRGDGRECRECSIRRFHDWVREDVTEKRPAPGRNHGQETRKDGAA